MISHDISWQATFPHQSFLTKPLRLTETSFTFSKTWCIVTPSLCTSNCSTSSTASCWCLKMWQSWLLTHNLQCFDLTIFFFVAPEKDWWIYSRYIGKILGTGINKPRVRTAPQKNSSNLKKIMALCGSSTTNLKSSFGEGPSSTQSLLFERFKFWPFKNPDCNS